MRKGRKSNIILVHRQMARDALREAERRAAGRKPVGLSDKAIEYLTRANPLAWISRNAAPEDRMGLKISIPTEKNA